MRAAPRPAAGSRLLEQRVELAVDRLLDRPLERGEEERKLHIEADVGLADLQRAGQSGSLERDVVAVPRIIEIEARFEIARDLLGGILRLLMVEPVAAFDGDFGHGASRALMASASIAKRSAGWMQAARWIRRLSQGRIEP